MASKSKTLAELLNGDVTIDATDIAAGSVTSAKLATQTGNVDFADNAQIRLGDSQDLQLYHDGSNSYIVDNGTGDLVIQASDDLLLESTSGENYINCNNDGSVEVYYNAGKKFETTATGIDVTGTAVTDGLTVAGNVSINGGTIKLDGNYPVGTGNVALGDAAMNGSISGNYNTALGDFSMQPMTSGASNTGVGGSSLRNISGGSYNTAVGHQSLHSNTSGGDNTAVGFQAGFATTTGGTNVFVGQTAGYNNTIGYTNTFIGYNSGSQITTGAKNTIIGRYNGNQGGLDIRTSSNNIVLSDGDGNPRVVVTPNGRMGVGYTDPNMDAQISSHQNQDARPSIDCRSTSYSFTNMVLLVGSNTNTTNATYNHIRCDIHGVAQKMAVRDSGNLVNANNSYGSLSDSRLKENIVDASSQWDDIKAVQVRKYNRLGDEQKELGVIAQELEAVGMGGLVEEGEYFDAIYNPNEETRKSVKYSILYMKAIKALQEAMERIETLEAKVAALEAN